MDIREKVKKLLALATSPNEHEAKAALLKAKEMMAKHKLSEAEVLGIENQKMATVTVKDVSWTTDSGNIWMVELVNLICGEHCCVGAWATPRKTRTHVLCITGMEDDVTVCVEVVKFAVGYIRGRTKRYASGYRVSYAKGFVMGLKMAYELQKEEHPDWGLVVVQPKEVSDYAASLSERQVKARTHNFDPIANLRGQHDGMNFNKQKVIGEA